MAFKTAKINESHSKDFDSGGYCVKGNLNTTKRNKKTGSQGKPVFIMKLIFYLIDNAPGLFHQSNIPPEHEIPVSHRA